MNKKVLILIVSIALVLGVIIFLNNQGTGNVVSSQSNRGIQGGYISQTTSPVSVSQINQLLYGLDTDELHNPFLSRNTPKIEILIDGFVFNSEVVKNKITTRGGQISDEDLRIIISSEDVLNALKSDPKIYLQDSVKKGNTQIVTVASKLELYSKGYLDLYETING